MEGRVFGVVGGEFSVFDFDDGDFAGAGGEGAGFEEEGFDAAAEFGGVELFGFRVIGGDVAAVDETVFVDGDVVEEAHLVFVGDVFCFGAEDLHFVGADVDWAADDDVAFRGEADVAGVDAHVAEDIEFFPEGVEFGELRGGGGGEEGSGEQSQREAVHGLEVGNEGGGGN